MRQASINTYSPSDMRNLVLVFVLVFVCSCSTTKYVPQIVEHTTHDTLYLNHQQYDSIYVHDSSTTNYHIGTIDTLYLSRIGTNLRVDTIYRDRIKTDYKYKLLRDTIYQVKCDSIPVIKEVEVVKMEKYIPPWCKWLAAVGALSLLLLVLMILRKVKVI